MVRLWQMMQNYVKKGINRLGNIFIPQDDGEDFGQSEIFKNLSRIASNFVGGNGHLHTPPVKDFQNFPGTRKKKGIILFGLIDSARPFVKISLSFISLKKGV
jgi:hypothetical protein